MPRSSSASSRTARHHGGDRDHRHRGRDRRGEQPRASGSLSAAARSQRPQRAQLPPFALGRAPEHRVWPPAARRTLTACARSSIAARRRPSLRATTSWRARASRSKGSPPNSARAAWAPVVHDARRGPEPRLELPPAPRAQPELEVLAVEEDRLVEPPEAAQRLGPSDERAADRPADPARNRRSPRPQRRADRRRDERGRQQGPDQVQPAPPAPGAPSPAASGRR